MRKLALSIAALTAVAAVVLAAGTALAGTAAKAKTVAFTGTYAGTAVVKVTGDIAAIATTGKGTGTLLGASKLTGKGSGDTSVQPCVPFGGTGSLVANKGKTKLNFKVNSGGTGCGDESGQVFSVTGRITVTGGFGALAKAKGSLKFTGNFDRGTTKFSVKFKGTLTVPK